METHEPSDTPDTHTTIELRLNESEAELIREIAQQADVTPEQAASVITVIALRREAREVERKTVAYLHTLSIDGGQTYKRLTFDRSWPFDDVPGVSGSTSTAELVYRGRP